MNTSLATVDSGSELVVIEGRQPQEPSPAWIYLTGLKSERSRATMQEALNTIATKYLGHERITRPVVSARRKEQDITCFFYPWGTLKPHEARALQTMLNTDYEQTTSNKMRASVRGVLHAAMTQTRERFRAAIAAAMTREERADLALQMKIDQDAIEDVIKCLKDFKIRQRERPLAGRMLDRDEVLALIDACVADRSAAGIRDAAFIEIMVVAGPRRAEVPAFDLADHVMDDLGHWLIVQHGKGDKARKLPINNGALAALQDWLSIRGDTPGPLFCPINKGGKLQLGKRMTAQAIYNMLEKRREQAGVKRFSPHDLRRTCASSMLDQGVDLVVVSQILGHENTSTTARYDRRGDQAKAKAARLLNYSYTRQRLD